MKLCKVEVINNSSITGTKNSLEFIKRDCVAMFLDYNDTLDGAFYLLPFDTYNKYIKHELEHSGLDSKLISMHNIRL